MGRMLISRGMALAVDDDGGYVVKVVKGFSAKLKDQKIFLEYQFEHPVLLTSLSAEQCPNRDYFLSKGLSLAVPMLRTNRLVGALCLGDKMNGQKFTKKELEFLNSLSNIAAAAIENALMFNKIERMNRQLDKKVQELNTLFDIGKELNSTLELAKIINILQFTIMGEMAVNKLLLFLKRNEEFYLAANRGVNSSSQLFQSMMEQPILGELAQQQSPCYVQADNLTAALALIRKGGFQVIVPMRIQQETKGILLLGPKMSTIPYADDELDFLSSLGNRAMISIENARLFEEALEKERLEEEIAIARDIQQRLLPSSFPQLDHLEIYGFNIPSRQVGGDYFDCFLLDDDRVALAIGDVSGKGIGAALLMSNLHAGLHILTDSDMSMDRVISRLNNLIYENTNIDKFITFFYAEYNVRTRILAYINAGHNPPYIFHRDGSCELLEKGGLLLGMMGNRIYETGYVTLAPGDFLITYTDGVTEAKNKGGDMYEELRLENLVRECMKKDVSVEDFANILINELRIFAKGVPQADDITMLALKLES
ncbi:SpoIIE family protein phosphatase [candidate division KSB1 bacterium]|nr:SpoIIE family protein phosphatase [candidate division KSB1 bacterium]